MARPRNFDEKCALERAMFVFWQRGYAGTSIADLVEATGLGRQSLYNAFGDKESLFRKTLRLYAETAAEGMQPLRDDQANLETIRSYLLNNVAQHQEAQCGACMFVKTAFDAQVPDPEIREAVVEAARGGRRAFAQTLRRAQERGEIAPNHDVQEVASLLFSLQSGLSALAQTGASRQELERTLDLALSPLRSVSSNPADGGVPRSTTPLAP